MSVEKKLFGLCEDLEIYEYTLTNQTGMTVCVLNRGGIIRNIFVPDRNGCMTDVVLAFDKPEDYIKNTGYFGSMIGRFANRLENSEFELNGKTYKVRANEGQNCLHGGVSGFDKKMWEVEGIGTEEEPALRLTYLSPDGEEGFPGNLKIEMTYKLTKENSIILHYNAVSDADTVINLTNHTYFNLAGHKSGAVDKQLLQLNCSFFTPNNKSCMPYGEILSVSGTPFDFRVAKPLGEAFAGEYEQISMFHGIDHNFIIDGSGYRCFAVAENPENGICMTCFTDKPAVQLYTGNALTWSGGKDGADYGLHGAFCLETQFYPNSMKINHFPSPVLKAGEVYAYTTEYKFDIK